MGVPAGTPVGTAGGVSADGAAAPRRLARYSLYVRHTALYYRQAVEGDG